MFCCSRRDRGVSGGLSLGSSLLEQKVSMVRSPVSGVSKFALCGVVHSFSGVGSPATLSGNLPILNSSSSPSLEFRFPFWEPFRDFLTSLRVPEILVVSFFPAGLLVRSVFCRRY